MLRRSSQRGFTLVELITVIAISAILFTIITIPMVQSFNLSRAAQGFADAQERARLLIDQLSREISNAAGVRDNSAERGQLTVVVPGQAAGTWEKVLVDNVKLDLIKPAQGDPLNPMFNPDNGKFDPTLRAPKGQITLPVAPGSTLVRFFVGLRKPLAGDGISPERYNNPYDGLLMARNSRQDNMYVLYRAEVQPRIYNRNTNQWETNTALFEADANGDPIYDDPEFFLPDGSQPKADRVRNWLGKSVVVTAISRFDMIQVVFNKNSRQVAYDGNVPRIFPLIQLTPTRIVSEPAESMMAVRSSEETDNALKVGPDVYRTEFGAWSQLFMRAWPTTYPQSPLNPSSFSSPWTPWTQNTPYLVGRYPAPNQALAPPGFAIYAYDPTAGSEVDSGVEIFDVKSYLDAAALDPLAINQNDSRRYPFSFALNESLNRFNWSNNQAIRQLFIAYAPAPRSGQILASFPITQVGGANNPALPLGQDNLPTSDAGQAFVPNNDPNIGGGNWYDYNTINQKFNKLWNQWQTWNQNWTNGVPNTIKTNLAVERWAKRFIDLRFALNADGTASPLHPTQGLPRARIVPGSEIVIAPDQKPGPNYGFPVQYTRVATRPVGPNQYYINYIDQREPDNWFAIAQPLPFGIVDNNSPNYEQIYDVQRYEAQNLISSVLQTQYRAGYVEFDSDFGTPIPQGNVTVFYRFQFTEPLDVIGVDYDSREVMAITLTIRNYPGTTVPNPQGITVKGSATVRNFIR